MTRLKIFAAIVGALLLAWVVSPPQVQPHIIFVTMLVSLTFSLFIHNQNATIMADLAQFEAAINRIDASTDNIANELRDLKDQLANQGLPKDVEDTVLARLEAAATKLEAVGKPVDDGAGGTLPGDGNTEAAAEGGGAGQG